MPIKYETLFSLGALATLPFLAFPSRVKEQIREEQNNECADCGHRVRKLQVHHIVPQSRGGSDSIENGVGLCPKCHQRWDLTSLTSDIIYPGVHYEFRRRKGGKRKR